MLFEELTRLQHLVQLLSCADDSKPFAECSERFLLRPMSYISVTFLGDQSLPLLKEWETSRHVIKIASSIDV